MAEPIKNITFGGVKLNANEITDKTVKQKDNSVTQYRVDFKNGTVAIYQEQNNEKACIWAAEETMMEKAKTNVSNMNEFSIYGKVDQDDNICLSDCENGYVTVRTKKSGFFEDDIVRIFGGKGNEVNLDKNDKLMIFSEEGKPASHEIKGTGLAAQDDYK
ncbi:MAG: hypothetical protein R3Y28_01935 [Candidatus Gastranaerophilales bacterium]